MKLKTFMYVLYIVTYKLSVIDQLKWDVQNILISIKSCGVKKIKKIVICINNKPVIYLYAYSIIIEFHVSGVLL